MPRFPWKVAPLLAEAKKVFLKATTHSGEQHKEAVTKETDTEAKSKGMKKDKKGKDKKQRKEKKSKVKDKKHKKHRDREPAKEEEIVDTQTGDKKGKDKKQRKEKKSKVKGKKHKKHRDREPAKEEETVDTQTGDEPFPQRGRRTGLGGATTAPLRPPAKTVDRLEGMTQHPRRQL